MPRILPTLGLLGAPLGVYLTVKGFEPAAVAALSSGPSDRDSEP